MRRLEETNEVNDMSMVSGNGTSDRDDQQFRDFYRALNELDDPRECVARIRERMAMLTAAGLEVPDDLVRTERRFQTECVLQSQGR